MITPMANNEEIFYVSVAPQRDRRQRRRLPWHPKRRRHEAVRSLAISGKEEAAWARLDVQIARLTAEKYKPA